MARPFKPRRIGFKPRYKYFKPQGVPIDQLKEVGLPVDELEAMRLHFVKGYDQMQSAREMGVSQSTFQRILLSASRKTAQAITYGQAIRVEGSNGYFYKPGK